MVVNITLVIAMKTRTVCQQSVPRDWQFYSQKAAIDHENGIRPLRVVWSQRTPNPERLIQGTFRTQAFRFSTLGFHESAGFCDGAGGRLPNLECQ